MDRGLFSESIIREFRKMKMHYIFPQRRNSTLISYKVKLDSAFIYNGSPIKSTGKSSRSRYIYIFQDPRMSAKEKSTILRDVAFSIKDMEYFEDRNGPSMFLQ